MEKPTKEPYFSKKDIGLVVTSLIAISRTIVGPTAKQQDLAATALNAIGLLKERIRSDGRTSPIKVINTGLLPQDLVDGLGMSREQLFKVYTLPSIMPPPINKFVQEYLEGNITQEQAQEIVDDLEAKARQYMFRNRIPIGSTDNFQNYHFLICLSYMENNQHNILNQG